MKNPKTLKLRSQKFSPKQLKFPRGTKTYVRTKTHAQMFVTALFVLALN
jgi:hypothetical protein